MARADYHEPMGHALKHAQRRRMFFFAGILLVLVWLLYLLEFHDPAIELLVYVGWLILVVGLTLILLAIATLRARGRPAEGKDFASTTTLVQGGIYGVVRHPLYLGWLLMYVAAILFSQHWIVTILATLGMACMVQITRQEDRHLIERFGDAYEQYRDSVPALNLAIGMARLYQRRISG
jgi:protein-S-isoprenylcysteine O-methyltransferase Ste14